MNLKSICIAAALTVVYTFNATAQTTSVAYVDIDRVTEKSQHVKKAMGNISDRVEGIQKDIETKRKRLTDVSAEVKKGEGILADSEMKKKKAEISKLENDLADLQYEGQRELRKLDTTFFEPMMKTIVLAIQDVAKEKHIDLVLRGEAVIYGANNADITDDVVKKLNSSEYNFEAKKSDSEESSKSESAKSKDSDKESSKEKDTSSDEDAKRADREAATNKSIIPSIPLVTRPVDRQQD